MYTWVIMTEICIPVIEDDSITQSLDFSFISFFLFRLIKKKKLLNTYNAEKITTYELYFWNK